MKGKVILKRSIFIETKAGEMSVKLKCKNNLSASTFVYNQRLTFTSLGYISTDGISRKNIVLAILIFRKMLTSKDIFKYFHSL